MWNAELYLDRLTTVVSMLDRAEIDRAISVIKDCWMANHSVITLGNGGSAMTALHYVTDWSKSITHATGRPFRGRSLIDNTGVITAYSNDVSYQDVFVEQLKWAMNPGDLVIAISGSGNSENVIRAVEYANAKGNPTLGISGYDGGILKNKAKYNVWVNCNDMQICEDIHLIFGHIAMKCLCVPIRNSISNG